MRIGQGFDAHRLVENRPLILGGVTVAYDKGLLGHSDADVLTHAICDALLGAAALGDLGAHFPDSDSQYKDCDSLVLLAKVGVLLREKGYRVVNIDSTILAQKPKLAPYNEAMRRKLADALGLEISAVSVKASTEEMMGYTGRGEGMAAHAIALIESCD